MNSTSFATTTTSLRKISGLCVSRNRVDHNTRFRGRCQTRDPGDVTVQVRADRAAHNSSGRALRGWTFPRGGDNGASPGFQHVPGKRRASFVSGSRSIISCHLIISHIKPTAYHPPHSVSSHLVRSSSHLNSWCIILYNPPHPIFYHPFNVTSPRPIPYCPMSPRKPTIYPVAYHLV